MATSLAVINNFLAQNRFAVIGVSRNPRDFTRSLYRELLNRGYQLVPVNPNAAEIEGQPCFARVQDVSPRVDGALLLTPPQLTEQAVKDCAQAGIIRVWMHRGTGRGSVSPSAVDFCREHGIQVIEGECPLMFLHQPQWFHRLHGFMKQLAGSYPH